MCGRYYVDDETAREIESLVQKIDDDMKCRSGEIRPSEAATVIRADQNRLVAESMKWGYPNYVGKGVMFNAKSETVREKVSFKESVMRRRCLIPAAGFYEWDQSKNKVTFQRADRKILYFAGIWKRYEDSLTFTILTTKANASVRDVHERMPLILEKEDMENWIFDQKSIDYILKRVPGDLKQIRDYQQETLSFI